MIANQQRARLAAIGALVTVLLVLSVIVLSAGEGTYRVTAVFSQVYGLVPGADVEVAGINVGSVQGITLGRDGLPHVTMQISDAYPLHAGASANLRAVSLAGEDNRFVSLQAGGGPLLPDGATLPLSHTSQPVEIYQVLDTLNPRARASVRSLLGGLDASLAQRGPDLRAALAHSAAALGNTAALLAEVNSNGNALRTFVTDGSDVVARLATVPDNIGHLADAMAAVLATTARRQAQLAQATELLAPGLSSPRHALDVLDRSVGTLRGLVRSATPGARELIPFSHALVPALLAAPPALAQADALVRQGPSDVRGLSPLVSKLRPLLPLLEEVLSSANPMLDQLRVRLPDLFSFFANWADFSADYDANGHGARIGLVFSPAPTNSIGGCTDRPGSLAVPFVRAPGVLGGQPWKNYASSFIGGGQATSAGAC
ncbi:MAG TPA: MlaD family protein [Solirubrobacteraceae bacterium]|nr:MlaD family protein [Solirubrobacteraceae bacterium]